MVRCPAGDVFGLYARISRDAASIVSTFNLNTARGTTRCRAANLAMVTVVGIRFDRGGTIPATVFSANSALPVL
jgi:hypothetical protein